MDNSLKGLLLAAGIIITCIVVSLGFYVARTSKDTATTGVNQITKLNAEFQESDKVMYDGLEVSGSEILNVINKYKNEEISIIVTTKKTTTSYVYSLAEENVLGTKVNNDVKNAQDIKSPTYINPNGQFTGSVLRDTNNTITGLKFEQN